MRRARATGLLALAFGLTAALFDTEPLWVPAATLALLAAGSAAWVGLGARGVRVRRTLAARRVVEGEPLTIELRVRAGRLGLPPSQVADPLLPAPVALRTGASGGRVRIEARFGRRGRRTLAPSRLLVGDPLGLATREVAAVASPADDEILVLPRIEPVVAAPGGGDATRIARRGRPVTGAETELDGIRPLRDGTPAARIYWPGVARGAELQERFLSSASESSPVVVLDPRGAADEDALDAAVRAAASLARALAGAGGCCVLLPGDRRPTELGETLAGWPQLHARLALVDPAAGPALAALAQRRGPIVFVSARRRSGLPQALGPAHGELRALVVPGSLPARHAAFAPASRPHRRRRPPGHGVSAPPTLAPPAPAPEPPPAARAAAGDLLPVPVARMIGFVALAGFGGLQWANMVHPAASGALLGSVLASAAAGAVLVAVARRRAPARVRLGATLGAAAVLLLVALAAAGVPRALLDPRGWT
ncbi:MAG TPA: DUF58 domain-containing protein [Solirubrobacteraceae bacterium]|nr:DUF58 domain-containing protein [Solirubrobacteraceae bacterium]